MTYSKLLLAPTKHVDYNYSTAQTSASSTLSGSGGFYEKAYELQSVVEVKPFSLFGEEQGLEVKGYSIFGEAIARTNLFEACEFTNVDPLVQNLFGRNSRLGSY